MIERASTGVEQTWSRLIAERVLCPHLTVDTSHLRVFLNHAPHGQSGVVSLREDASFAALPSTVAARFGPNTDVPQQASEPFMDAVDLSYDVFTCCREGVHECSWVAECHAAMRTGNGIGRGGFQGAIAHRSAVTE